MKLSFTLKTLEPKIKNIFKDLKVEVVDAVIRQVSARSSEELLTTGGKAMLKEEIINEINIILKNKSKIKNPVIDLFFTDFIIK